MPSDASLPPNAPMTNGATDHGEVDASSSSSLSPSLSAVCADLHARVSAFLAAAPKNHTTRRTQEQTRVAIEVIEKALQDYSFDSLSISYNGGKDCLVLLILYLSTLHTHFSAANPSTPFPTSVPSIYAKPPDPFPAVTSFVHSSTQTYHLNLTHISTTPAKHSFRDAFASYLHSHPRIKAIFVGTRRTDPHGLYLTHFQHTDHGWPAFMRIHPVLDWHLDEIWTFLRAEQLRDKEGKGLEYCEMYDAGYTSLGGVGDTLRNPRLRYTDGQGEERYRPAYELVDDGEERLGRE